MVGKYATKWGMVEAGITMATIPTLFIYILLIKNIHKSLAMGLNKDKRVRKKEKDDEK